MVARGLHDAIAALPGAQGRRRPILVRQDGEARRPPRALAQAGDALRREDTARAAALIATACGEEELPTTSDPSSTPMTSGDPSGTTDASASETGTPTSGGEPTDTGVDLNPDIQRSDILSPGWESWKVKDGSSASATFNGVTFTLKGTLKADWHRAGLIQNVGLICGAISRNLVVLDLDGAAGYPAFAATFPHLTDTFTVATGGGVGRHVYFYTDRLPLSLKAMGTPIGNLELCANGRQVVAPPSIHPVTGQAYRVEQPLDILRVPHLDDLATWIESFKPREFFTGGIMGVMTGVYYWLPKWTGHMYNERLGKLHFWLTVISFNLTFMPQFFLGLAGMPRRIPDYALQFAEFNAISTVGAFILGLSQLLFAYNIWRCVKGGEKASDAVWEGTSGLEWQLSSPPPHHSWDIQPVIKA